MVIIGYQLEHQGLQILGKISSLKTSLTIRQNEVGISDRAEVLEDRTRGYLCARFFFLDIRRGANIKFQSI